MRKLRIGIMDILGKSTARRAFSRYMRANNMSIMPQVLAVWCEEMGHEVHYAYYDGPKLFAGGLPDDLDVVFINTYSQTAMLGYAFSAYFRDKGMITILGGPHARSYPDDSVKYFDYALGFTDKPLLTDLFETIAQQRPVGVYLTAKNQPKDLVPLEQRWKFVMPAMEKAPILRLIPIIGSLGCPYTCSFCIDALVPYQPLNYEMLKDDLRFMVKNNPPRALAAWHDPNFGIRFDDYMNVIEEAIKPGSLTFLGETSLSRLSEENCKRMRRNGFRVIAPGIESWYDIGDKSKMRATKGLEKVERISEHFKMITRHFDWVQGNIIFGLDADEGPEPFELTRHFVDLTPEIYPYFSLLSSYGRNAPDNLQYQRDGRVLNIPFHFLNQLHAMNVRPKNYSWPELFDHIVETYAYAYSRRAMYRRFKAVRHPLVKIETLFRGASVEGDHKLNNMRKTRARLNDPKVRAYFDGETDVLPDFFIDPIKKDLGWLWEWLPEGAIYHDPNAYLKSLNGSTTNDPVVRAGMATA